MASKHNEKFLKPNRKYLNYDFTDHEIEEEMKKIEIEFSLKKKVLKKAP